jgi:stage V sporulation protein B
MLAVTTAGFQMAISRMCAASFALGKKEEGYSCFFLATLFSFVFTVILSFFLFHYAEFFSKNILKEGRTAPLIRLLAFSLPLSALHGCITGFYYSQKKTLFPSLIQIGEQLIRVGITLLLYRILLSEGKEVTALIAAGGALAGELFSALFSLIAIGLKFREDNFRPSLRLTFSRQAKQLFATALPLSLNRILLTLLGSIEVVLIPTQLCRYGLSSTEALSVYGIFTGMALPLIQFPSTITHSISVMLTPSVARLQALGYQKKIRHITGILCLFLFGLGAFCCLLFYFGGDPIGLLLFKNESAGIYIRCLAFLCPFLYLDTTLAGILHGMGRSGVCLLHTLAGTAIRLGFVIFSIPCIGIRGYLYGLLLSEMALCLLHISDLQMQFSKNTEKIGKTGNLSQHHPFFYRQSKTNRV